MEFSKKEEKVSEEESFGETDEESDDEVKQEHRVELYTSFENWNNSHAIGIENREKNPNNYFAVFTKPKHYLNKGPFVNRDEISRLFFVAKHE